MSVCTLVINHYSLVLTLCITTFTFCPQGVFMYSSTQNTAIIVKVLKIQRLRVKLLKIQRLFPHTTLTGFYSLNETCSLCGTNSIFMYRLTIIFALGI